MTLRELRIQLGWSQNRLAKEAKVARGAVTNAENGTPIRAETAKALADAFTKGYGREITVLDIDGLNIQ
jgi:transcriptional regulator with XRE-family HTH domain